MSRARRYAYRWLPAVVVFVASIAFWELLVRLFDVQDFLLPAPSDILATLRHDWGELWSAAFFTFREALAGYVIGCSAWWSYRASVVTIPGSSRAGCNSAWRSPEHSRSRPRCCSWTSHSARSTR